VRQRNSRSPGLISAIDASAFAGILVVPLLLLMMLTQTPHHGVSADLPKVWPARPEKKIYIRAMIGSDT
jgi:hypothetical protein